MKGFELDLWSCNSPLPPSSIFYFLSFIKREKWATFSFSQHKKRKSSLSHGCTRPPRSNGSVAWGVLCRRSLGGRSLQTDEQEICPSTGHRSDAPPSLPWIDGLLALAWTSEDSTQPSRSMWRLSQIESLSWQINFSDEWSIPSRLFLVLN